MFLYCTTPGPLCGWGKGKKIDKFFCKTGSVTVMEEISEKKLDNGLTVLANPIVHVNLFCKKSATPNSNRFERLARANHYRSYSKYRKPSNNAIHGRIQSAPNGTTHSTPWDPPSERDANLLPSLMNNVPVDRLVNGSNSLDASHGKQQKHSYCEQH